MAMLLFYTAVLCICGSSNSATIEVPECDPPDFPLWGGYGPKQDFYVAGDVIHYYCDTDTYIAGFFYRRCEDTGDWIGHTPVCDPPASFQSTNQTSIADPKDGNGADRAVDGFRSTCSTTKHGPGNAWIGVLAEPGTLYRVMIFFPKINVAYEVFMIKENGDEYSCGSRQQRIESLNWEFHNCPEANYTDVVAIKIKSLSSAPLQICEVIAHTLTFPNCLDPHLRIENGRLQLSRKTANLICDNGYTKSLETNLDCVRNTVWNRKHLYCSERQWEVGSSEAISDLDP